MSIESTSSEQVQVQVPAKNLLHLAERLEADGDEHGVAACLRQLTADSLTVAPPSGLAAQHVAMLIPMRDDCRSHRMRPETDTLNAAIELLSSASLEAEFSAHHAGDCVVREYVEPRDAYEAATKPLNSHAPPRYLRHGDPVALRYQHARAALVASQSSPHADSGGDDGMGRSSPVDQAALARSIVELDELLLTDCSDPLSPSEGESIMLVLHEIKRLRSHPDLEYADADALIAHLHGLCDDGGQGGEKWAPAQAAIAGIRQQKANHAEAGAAALWCKPGELEDALKASDEGGRLALFVSTSRDKFCTLPLYLRPSVSDVEGAAERLATVRAEIEQMIQLRTTRSPSLNQLREWSAALLSFIAMPPSGSIEPKADHCKSHSRHVWGCRGCEELGARSPPKEACGPEELLLASTCRWTLDDAGSNVWRSVCGECWSLIDGSPADNNCRFCHGCGKPVAISAIKDAELARLNGTVTQQNGES